MRLVLVSLSLALAAPAVAAPAQDADQTQAAEPVKAKEKKICKVQEASSTSRMRKRVCRTATEWENANKEGSNAADLQRMGAR